MAFFFAPLLIFSTGCQLGYYIHTGYHQGKILWSRTDIEKVLKSDTLNENQKTKLTLAKEAKDFAETSLGLKSNGNYESFVALDRDAVTYVVQVAYADKLKSYKWSFPFIGAVPYKGYFIKEMAQEEAAKFPPEEYDTWVRGVKAYSTLGWFKDPLTSPMLKYSDQDLVEVIIHELTHTTIYLKNAADFNERLATFVGVQGAKMFFQSREGSDSKTAKLIDQEQLDLNAFSHFISEELAQLKEWYNTHSSEEIRKEKESRLKDIQNNYTLKLKPKMKTSSYDGFAKENLNNAILMSYNTYVSDLSDFQSLFDLSKRDLNVFMEHILSLKDSKDPSGDMRRLTESLTR